jgi:hypothetical protein
VEDHARPLAREHLVDQRGVLDVADHGHQRKLRNASVSAVWISYTAASEMSYRTSRAGRKRCDLAGELGADRAARAGDHHDAIA